MDILYYITDSDIMNDLQQEKYCNSSDVEVR